MTQFETGWLLFALMIALTLFNARKKLPFLPVLSATAWLRFHIWAGLISAAVFFWHIGWRWPSGWFNWIFTALYALVMISGIIGWLWSRTIPRQLTARRGEVILEQIPARRAALRAQAETLALQSPLLGKFYVEQLHDSWAGAMAKLDNLKKFLDEKERAIADQLAALARENDDLDFHHARQLRLKGWLFVHIPLTYSLLIFSVAHVVVVYAFSGGAP
jgi:hypothetical protein